MSREDAERLYRELLCKLAKQHFEGNAIGAQATLKEIDRVRARLLNLDIAEALKNYETSNQDEIKVQR